MKTNFANILLIICLTLISNFSYSGDLIEGKAIAAKTCATCHGLDGQATSGGNSAITPNLTGQQKEYLIAKLKDYKAGKLQDGIMTIVAQMLNDDDIENVSEWYSKIKISIELPVE